MQSQIQCFKNETEKNDGFIARYEVPNSEQVLRQIFPALLVFTVEVVGSLFQ